MINCGYPPARCGGIPLSTRKESAPPCPKIVIVSTASGLSKKDAASALNATIDAITASLKEGEKVVLPCFGTFEVREKAARQGRNPHTGETVEIAAKKAPTFKPGATLKNAVNK